MALTEPMSMLYHGDECLAFPVRSGLCLFQVLYCEKQSCFLVLPLEFLFKHEEINQPPA